MKRIFGIAIVLALLASLCFGGIVLAADPPEGVHTSWSFDGEGEISIDTLKDGGANGEDHLFVRSYGSGSSGQQDVSATPHGYAWCGTNFVVDRHVDIMDGVIETFTVRDNDYPYWTANTEYGTYLDVDSTGSLEQHYVNSYFAAIMNTDIYADGAFEMGTMTEGEIGGYWFFGIGAMGEDSVGEVHLHTTDWAEHNGTRCLQGDFHVDADPASAGFSAEWENEATFGGSIETPNITEYFDVDVDSSGSYGKSASASLVIITGFINGGQYHGMN